MTSDEIIQRLLDNLDCYVVRNELTNSDKFVLESASGERVILNFLEKSDEWRVEGVVNFPAEYLTLTSFSRMAHLAYLADHAISWPSPFREEDTFVKLSIRHSADILHAGASDRTSLPDELRYILDKTAYLVAQLQAYVSSVIDACEMTHVDFSMFADSMDLDRVDLISLCEMKDSRYGSWGKYISSVESDSEMDLGIKDVVLLYLNACREFEASNPTLNLGEVARHLTREIADYRDKEVEPADVN